MTARCEATRLRATWTRERCKRNATTVVAGRSYCEQHAKIAVGMAAAVRLDSRDAAEAWQRRIREGQRDALRRYGHLSNDELRELGRKGKLPRPVVEFLIAAAHVEEQA